MPKGSTLMVVAHYDNSRANRFNPDPTATVRWGDQTWEEMLIGYYGTIEVPGRPRRARVGANCTTTEDTDTNGDDTESVQRGSVALRLCPCFPW